MKTILPKEPIVTERKSVILSNAERRNIRRKLRGSVDVAKNVLSPRNQLKRFIDRNTIAAKRIGGKAKDIARNNAPVIGAVGLGTLLLIGRGPISKWISRMKKPNEPTDN